MSEITRDDRSSVLPRAPICIISFNRPDYLRVTLESIRNSLSYCGFEARVVLFQDGNISPHNGLEKSRLSALETCKEVFRGIFPTGEIRESQFNLGIAMNIYRAERWAFLENTYDVAFFFEDDMYIAPIYFSAMLELNRLAECERRIGMFSAYGSDVTMSPADQHHARRGVGAMHHNWAFGLRRTAWIARETHTREYMSIIEHCDYRARSLGRIALWYHKMGWPVLQTNQDIVKNVALNHEGMIRITTNVILANYIGKMGEHYTIEEFERLKFGEAKMFCDFFPEEEIELDQLTPDAIDSIWIDQRKALMSMHVDAQQLRFDPDFAVVAEIIENLGGSRVFVSSGRKTYIKYTSGIYEDLWCSPNATITIGGGDNVERVKLIGLIGPHLPSETTIRFLINGILFCVVTKGLKEEIEVDLKLSSTLHRLNKIISIVSDIYVTPFAMGQGNDRRLLSFNIRCIALESRNRNIIIPSDQLRSEIVGD